jgi:hypothetical protein
MAESLRQRNPFRFVSDIPEIDQDAPERVLDEQGAQASSWKPHGKPHCVLTGMLLEQEAIIEQLHEENVRISRLYVIVGSIGISFSS